MGKPKTLLEGLCGHALSFGAGSIAVDHKEDHEWVFARKDRERFRIACYRSSSADGRELLENLHAAVRKPVRQVLNGKLSIIKVVVDDSSGEDHFEVTITPAPRADPSIVPSFTAKQGQYLAFIYHYSTIHRQAPAESDLQRYFRVSPPSVHEMIKTLERNALIERTPGQARSIRLLVLPEHLPPLQ